MNFQFKGILLCILFALVSLALKSQEVEINTHGIINKDIDTISYCGNSKKMFKPLFSKFRSMIIGGNRQINIIHIGDDYIGAETMTEETRKSFQSFMTGLQATRGMVSPIRESSNSYKIKYSSGWKYTNVLSNTDKTSTGLWLSSVYTNGTKESIEINVNNKNSVKYDFNSFRVYHSDLNAADKIKIEDFNIAYQTIHNREEGYTEFVLSDYVSSVKVVINRKSREDFYIYGFYFQNQDAGVVYNSIGLSDLKTEHLTNNAGLLYSQLKTLAPDVVILSFGLNDSSEEAGENQFEENLEALINGIRKVCPNVPVLLTTPVETWVQKRKINTNITQNIRTINSVATRTDCALFDLYAIMGGANSARRLQSSSLMQNDLIHLTNKGYQLAGDLLYNALWKEVETQY